MPYLMYLYHFTGREYLPAILAQGLTRGDVPTSPTTGVNAVWLTTSSTPKGHGLSMSRHRLNAEERAYAEKLTGRKLPKRVFCADKSAVRIRVVIDAGDKNIVRWVKIAPKIVEPNFLDHLHRGKQAETWWLYFGVISPEMFETIEFRRGDRYVKAADQSRR